MTPDILTALSVFALVSSITPGPNNLMLMASGANYGFRPTIPHMLGIGLGFMFMLFLVGIGLIGVFDAIPYSYETLKLVSILYLCWLAWRVANAAPPDEETKTGKPFTFLQAAAFQWVNPKAWTMALTAMTLYAPDRSLWAILVVTTVFGLINMPSVSLWTLVGQKMQIVLTSRIRLRIFNITMAVLLVGSLIPVVFQ
jgi:threonine/homoserine/homoserine lactone efflux protein